jgi:snRNA-activating protein complex subunit 3
MEEVCFEALELRLGYPYLYSHHGNCEHLMIFRDMR